MRERQKAEKFKAIGRGGAAEVFIEEFKKAGTKRLSDQQDPLTDGAIEAFQAGRPENLQMLLRDVRYGHFNSSAKGDVGNLYFAAKILRRAVAKSEDKQAAIELAVAKTSAADRQRILDNSLAQTINDNFSSSGDNIEDCNTFLKLGADPNARVFDVRGYSLIAAAAHSSPTVVRKLYEHGAKFDETLAAAETPNSYYKQSAIARLQFYRETMADPQQPAPVPRKEEGAEDVQGLMIEQLLVLSKQVRDMAEEIKGLKDAVLTKESGTARPANRKPRDNKTSPADLFKNF